jgi:isochorismate hydrolase
VVRDAIAHIDESKARDFLDYVRAHGGDIIATEDVLRSKAA